MQCDLPSIDLPARRPLSPIALAVSLLNLDPRAVLAACERGDLEWSFDLAAPGSRRRAIRIWRGSLIDAVRHVRVDRPDLEVLSDIIPPHHPRSSEVCRRLQISRDLLADLIRSGKVAVATAARAQQGVNAACRLDHDSLVAFLLSRRLGAAPPLNAVAHGCKTEVCG